MNSNRVKKCLNGIFTVQSINKETVCTYENKFVTFNKLKVDNDRLLTRFSESNWKQLNKFILSIKQYDKYYDTEIEINKDLITFKTNHKFEYNVKFEIRLENNNMNKYSIDHRDLVVINNLIKEFGKIKSVSFYKYQKTIVRLLFNKYEIYLII